MGDSFTYGQELADREKNAWPFVLGGMIGADVVNLGQPGTSNRFIVTEVVKHVSNAPIRPDLVVLGWTSPGRVSFGDLHGVFDVWPGQDRFSNQENWRNGLLDWLNKHHNDEWLYDNFILDLALITNFLENKQIKYCMMIINGSDYYHSKYWYNIDDKIKEVLPKINDNWLEFPKFGMMQWALESKSKFGPGGHFLEKGHQVVAGKVYEHIRNKQWVS